MYAVSSTLERAVNALRRAQHVVVLTGAGASAESGLPTFRDKQTGLWARYDPLALATPEAFRRDPALVWAWYEWRRGLVLQAEPNAGHRAIAELARRVPRFTLVTQNVDDLHERAESDPVIHVHGQILRPYCEACLCSYRFPPGLPIERERIEPPRCKACGARVRPGVVWFGDPMPHGAWKLARDAAASCDLMLCVGTSGAVATATSLVQLALTSKALVVDINPEPGKLGAGVISLRGTAGAVLPQLVAT